MDLNAIAKLADSIWNGRDSFNEGFEELARYVYPQARGFESQANKGAEDREYIWDSTPEEAALTLSAALGSLLTTPSGNWFALDLQGEDAPGGESGRWLTDVARAMLDAFNAPNSLFYQELNTFYMDLSVLAWAVLYSEYRDGEGLSFRAISPNQCALAEDARGRVDTVVRRYEQSAGQLAEEFTPESLPESVKEALKNDSQKLFKVNHIVLPRAKMPQEAKTEYMGGGGEKSPGDNGPHEFVSIVYIDKAEKPLSQRGFHALPYVCPLWSKRSGAFYVRGCGHSPLPDIPVLNRVSLS